jgi:hypothetical protein
MLSELVELGLKIRENSGMVVNVNTEKVLGKFAISQKGKKFARTVG